MGSILKCSLDDSGRGECQVASEIGSQLLQEPKSLGGSERSSHLNNIPTPSRAPWDSALVPALFIFFNADLVSSKQNRNQGPMTAS